MDDMTKIPFFPKDGIVTLEIGGNMVEQLHSLQQFLLTDHKDDIAALQQHITDKVPLTSWETSLVTVHSLLKAIFTEGESKGILEYKLLSDIIS